MVILYYIWRSLKQETMPKKVSKLPASDRIRKLLLKENARTNISVSLQKRISIILSGISGKSIYQTFHELETTDVTVRKWRTRWEELYDSLELLETEDITENGGSTDRELAKRIKEILADKARSGTPKTITMFQEDQIVALATRTPEDYNIPMTNWTHELLAEVAISEQIVGSISPSYVGIIFKKTN